MILKSFIFYSLCFYLKKNSFFENEYFLNMFKLINTRTKFRFITFYENIRIF